METADKQCQYKNIKNYHSIGILYKSRGMVKQPSLKQLYIFFIYCHLNYANIAWASNYKSKLEGLYRHQKHVAPIINEF